MRRSRVGENGLRSDCCNPTLAWLSPVVTSMSTTSPGGDSTNTRRQGKKQDRLQLEMIEE
jgi:hypothetical protein